MELFLSLPYFQKNIRLFSDVKSAEEIQSHILNILVRILESKGGFCGNNYNVYTYY